MDRDGWTCHICGEEAPRELRGTMRWNAPELDHIIPLSAGGSHTVAISLGETAVRNLAGKATGSISLGNLYGKTAGTTIIVTEGSYTDGGKVPFVYAGYAGTGAIATYPFGSISPTTYKGVFIKAIYNVIGSTQIQIPGNIIGVAGFLTTMIVNTCAGYRATGWTASPCDPWHLCHAGPGAASGRCRYRRP